MKSRTSVFLFFLIAASLVTSSCGMRRALTLPPREKAQKEVENLEKKKIVKTEEVEEIKSE